MVSDGVLKFNRTRRTSGAEKTYNHQPLAAESRNQQEAVLTADDMMKADTQAEAYGDRQRTKQPSSLRLLLQNIQRSPLSIRDHKQGDIVAWIRRYNHDIAISPELKTYSPNTNPQHK